MPHNVPTLLEDIRQATERVQQFTAAGTLEGYRADMMLQAAVERQFIIIGEALSRLEKIDMDERKRTAAAEARPFKDKANQKNQQAAQWKERFKELKKAKPKDEAAIANAEAQIKALTKDAKQTAARAKEIEDAVYDLKAVNPHKKLVIDTRTPEELLDIIEQKGKEIADFVPQLRAARAGL